MSVREEFQDFVANGNMVDVAVGFVMGAIFKDLIDSLVGNIIMPIVAIPFGEPNFDAIVWTVNDSDITVGAFLTSLVAFFLVAVGLFFFFVKPMNVYRSRQRAQHVDEPEGPTEVELLTQIRDSLARA
jgi:large conductance mechanosensitive channel